MQTDKTVIFVDGDKLNYQLSNLALKNPNAKPRRERVRISTFTKIKVKKII